MNITYLRRVRKNFNCGDRRIDRHNQRAWVRSVRYLGDKWVGLPKPVAQGVAK